MINQREMMAVLEKFRSDAIVISTMTASRAWMETSHNQIRDVPVGGAMGKASSVALGLALAQPDCKVVVLDGDGSLEMNMGTMATIAGKRPANLYHFVLENGVYAVTGGQPIPATGTLSFAKMAKEAGYVASYEFDNMEDFTTQIQSVLEQKGPVFITIKTEPEIQNEPIPRRPRLGLRSTSVAFQELRDNIGD
ncbi:thiamine pyrophosphate-dependent enzyme [Dehalococcoidia bacterium]|nr:thiamine pyrophosphate-dependent enzyme [Dehalococcoidia bacterium]